MSVPIFIRSQWERPPEVSVRAWRDLMRASHVEIGEHWHRTMLPLRFEQGAREVFGFAPRTKGYLARKTNVWRRGKAAPPWIDLVFTGEMRRTMKSMAIIRGFPSRTTVELVAPRYMTFRPRGNQPDKHAEVTRLLPREAQDLSEMLNERVTERLNALREPRTETHG